MKKLILLLISAAVPCLTSCTSHLVPLLSIAHFSRPLDSSSGLSTSGAAIYGRFMTGPEFAFGNELALRVRNVDSKRVYLIRCREKDPVYAIAVEPGRYEIAGFIGTFMDHRPAVRGGAPQLGPFGVRSNSATYVGDLIGYARTGGMIESWGFRDFTNNFAATTDEFRQKYQNLASTQVFSAFDELPK